MLPQWAKFRFPLSEVTFDDTRIFLNSLITDFNFNNGNCQKIIADREHTQSLTRNKKKITDIQ